ncbi:MAG: DUF427 domain-containing protein [Acidimicrobiales bacterium]
MAPIPGLGLGIGAVWARRVPSTIWRRGNLSGPSVVVKRMASKQRVRIEHNPKWIRGVHGGHAVVDSRNARFVWEIPYYPSWYFPLDDVHGELVENGETLRSPSRGEGTRYDLVVDGETIPNAAWRHLDSPVEELRGLVRFEWDAIDSWFEEDVEVFVHPRDPGTRVDVLPSSRRVRVLVDGEVLADSVRSSVLYETGAPARYYLPKVDVRMDLLTPTDTSSACPYKGWANYWNVSVGGADHSDLAWGYRTALPESAGITGLVCFYNEKVDIEIDGTLLEREKSHFA